MSVSYSKGGHRGAAVSDQPAPQSTKAPPPLAKTKSVTVGAKRQQTDDGEDTEGMDDTDVQPTKAQRQAEKVLRSYFTSEISLTPPYVT